MINTKTVDEINKSLNKMLLLLEKCHDKHDIKDNTCIENFIELKNNVINSIKKERLQYSETLLQYNNLLDSMFESYFETNMKKEITYVNVKFFNMFHVLNKNILNINTHIQQKIKRVIDINNLGKKTHHRFKFKNINTKTLELSLYFKFNTNGKIIGYCGMFKDISNRIKYERKIKKSKIKLKKNIKELNCLYNISKLIEKPNISINSMINGIIRNIPYIWNNYSHFTVKIIYNDKEYSSINYIDTEWFTEIEYTKNLLLKVNSKHEKKFTTHDTVLLNEICLRLKNNILQRDNKIKQQKFNKRFNEKLQQEVIKKTKELNKVLEKQTLYINQILKSSNFKTTFMSTMSHELRTPLNSIIGFSELLLEESYGNLNDEQKDFLIVLKSSADGLLEMINHILDISKIEAGKFILNKENVKIKPIVKHVHNTIKFMYIKKQLKFNINGLNTSLHVYADPIRLQEILLNLLGNAIKFTFKGSIQLIIQENTHDITFLIKDTGIGIEKKDFNIIFKDFQRVNSNIVNNINGTGLGLSLTKRLINLHGGEIYLKSKIGKGSTFSFFIPKVKN